MNKWLYSWVFTNVVMGLIVLALLIYNCVQVVFLTEKANNLFNLMEIRIYRELKK